MEKMRPMEGKLKYQIDRLIKLAAMDPNELQQNAAAILRPNPKALLEKFKISEISKKKNGKKGKQGSDDEVSDEENEDDESNEESEAGDDYSGEEEQKESAIYKAPRFAAMHYKDAESEANKRDDKIQKQRKRLKNSELLATLQEEFGDAPTVY